MPDPAASSELVTVRDYLRYAVSRFTAAQLFFGHGSDNAWDEAVYLTLHTLSLPLDRLEPFLDAKLLPHERAALLDIYRRRCEERLPAAYLTHEAWLGEHRFYVDERTIVPRSFIAELLLEQLTPWVEDPWAIHNALDLCTGSGCLAILTALAFPEAEVDAVDLSDDALGVAERNIGDYELRDRINLVQSDAFTKLTGKRYDLIISNPPYVNAESVDALPPEYLHEPELALGSGEDGLDFTRIILREAKKHLTEDGLLIVEIGHNRDALEAAYPDLPFTWLDTAAGDEYVFMLRAEDLPDKAPGLSDKLFEIPSPFEIETGTVLMHEPSWAREGELRAQLLDESYPKPFVIDDGKSRFLYFNVRLMQSEMSLKAPNDLAIRYTQKMMAFLLFLPRPKRIVLIGLGGGSLIKFCYYRLPGTQLTAVELDPEVIAFRDTFLVPPDDTRLQVLQADGAEYLENTEKGIDVLLVDAFDKTGFAPSLANREFFENAFAKLSGNGVLVINLAGEKETYAGLIGEAMHVFDDQVIVISVPDDGNHVLYAFKERYFEPRWRWLHNYAKELRAKFGLDFPAFVQKMERSTKLGLARREALRSR